MECTFCQIVAGELPSTKIYEDAEVLAFKDIKPEAPVHVLIVPKKHIGQLSETTEADKPLLGHLQWVIKKVADQEGITHAFKVASNNGRGAGQIVFHLHYHLLGGWPQKK